MSNVFTSLIAKVLPVPSDEPHTITIRKLAPKHLDAARKASQARSLGDLREMGGPAFLKELQAMQTAAPAAVADGIKADPLLVFDRGTLLAHGITAWSYEQELSAASRDDLDETTAEWLAREILTLAKPSLFEDAEVALKNG